VCTGFPGICEKVFLNFEDCSSPGFSIETPESNESSAGKKNFYAISIAWGNESTNPEEIYRSFKKN